MSRQLRYNPTPLRDNRWTLSLPSERDTPEIYTWCQRSSVCGIVGISTQGKSKDTRPRIQYMVACSNGGKGTKTSRRGLRDGEEAEIVVFSWSQPRSRGFDNNSLLGETPCYTTMQPILRSCGYSSITLARPPSRYHCMTGCTGMAAQTDSILDFFGRDWRARNDGALLISYSQSMMLAQICQPESSACSDTDSSWLLLPLTCFV